jgi:hypothetical protein
MACDAVAGVVEVGRAWDSVVGSQGATGSSSGFVGGVTARHSWWLGLSGSRGSGHRNEWGRGGPVTVSRVVGTDG